LAAAFKTKASLLRKSADLPPEDALVTPCATWYTCNENYCNVSDSHSSGTFVGCVVGDSEY